MIPAANRYTVVLDASVLFPNTKRDLLLRFFEADLYRARWSETIQQEWLRNAKEKYPKRLDNLERVDSLMREHFMSAWIDEDEFEKFIDLIDLPDSNDRHVVATAISCKASYVVTDNLKHFPEAELDRFDLEVGSADKFLSGTFDHYTNEALNDLKRHRLGLRSQPSVSEYIMLLRARELPLLASRLQPFKELL